MELTIKYIATVDVESGQIQSVSFTPGGPLPSEGISDGKETVWIRPEEWPSGIDNLQIHEEYYRENGKWIHRGSKPNNYYDWNLETKKWTLNSELLFIDLRQERDNRLYLCDWTQVADAPLNSEQVEAWKLYRQSLRDFPDSCTNINSLEGLVWPTPPE